MSKYRNMLLTRTSFFKNRRGAGNIEDAQGFKVKLFE